MLLTTIIIIKFYIKAQTKRNRNQIMCIQCEYSYFYKLVITSYFYIVITIITSYFYIVIKITSHHNLVKKTSYFYKY